MNIRKLRILLGLIATVHFTPINFLSAETKVIETAKTTDAPELAVFKDPKWTTNATLLNDLMSLQVTHQKDTKGIKAMYLARLMAAKHLNSDQTRTVTTDKTVVEKTHALLEPVKEFLPKVKVFKKLLAPLIEISLNRKPTAEELELHVQFESVNFDNSFFKKSLATEKEINHFIEEHILTEADFTQLCHEFHRVFGDLLNHAIPELKHAFEKQIEELKHKKAEAAAKEAQESTPQA